MGQQHNAFLMFSIAEIPYWINIFPYSKKTFPYWIRTRRLQRKIKSAVLSEESAIFIVMFSTKKGYHLLLLLNGAGLLASPLVLDVWLSVLAFCVFVALPAADVLLLAGFACG